MMAIALFNFWKCFNLVVSVEYFSSKNFFPNKVWGEILFWQKGKFLSNYSKKTSRLKMSGFLFFMFSNRCSLETYQQNKTICVLQIWVKIKLITSILRALGRELISYENTQRITNPSEASNNFFFVERPRILMAVAT